MMADKYNKLEPKVPKEVLISLAAFVVIILALFLIIKPTNQDKIYSAYSADANSDFTEDHPFYELSYNQLTRKLDSDEYVFLFIGTPDSSAAVAYIGTIQKYYEELGIDEYAKYIYYYNPTDDDDNFLELQDTYEDLTSTTFQLVLFINGEYSTRFYSNGTSDTQLMNRATKDFFDDAIAAIEEAA